jgi:peptidoglycan/LPS O-acetylase OafA/YrhL
LANACEIHLLTTESSDSVAAIRGYRPELDVVRFLAFLLVFIHHFSSSLYWGSENIVGSGLQRCGHVLSSLEDACAMGLCLFFTLSAYLITDLLLDRRDNHGGFTVWRFYVRRALRIWPLYFTGIAIGVAISVVFHERAAVSAFGWYLLFGGNFFIASFGYFGNPMMPLWSISIEEQFYLISPWAIRWFSRRGLLLFALFLILAANITLFALGQRHADTNTTVWANTFVQFEMFATGMLLALAKKQLSCNQPRLGWMLALIGPILWFIACFVFRAKQQGPAGMAISGITLSIGYALIAVGCASILQGFCMIGPSQVPRWAVYLGRISYGLYVFHVVAIELTRAHFQQFHGLLYTTAAALAAFLVTVSAGVLSYTYLESPFLRVKRRFEVVHSKPI